MVSGIELLRSWYKKEASPWMFSGLLSALAGMVILLAAPGNRVKFRLEREMSDTLPESLDDRVPGNTITFSNVIVQGVTMKWKGSTRPDPVMTGTGNADYFIGGRHIAGVWEREDYNSRTVFYGPDGEEIELQRGRTLIILMGYNNKGTQVSYE